LVLDAPPKLLDSRRSDKDAYEKNQNLQLKTSALYKELAPRFGWSVIDATRSVEQIHDSIVELVKNLLGREREESR
jgi:thymidylate kinase